MIFIAYLTLLLAIFWLLSGRPAASRVDRVARLIAVPVAVALIVVGLLQISRHTATTAGNVLLVILALGAGTYLSGVLLWDWRTGRRLRAAGWVAVVVSLAVPTTLSLALPLVALLVPTLQRDGQADSGAAPSREG